MSGNKILAEIVRESPTQREFAERAGCSQALISQYIHGNLPISLRMAKRFGKLSGRPAAEFLDLEAS